MSVGLMSPFLTAVSVAAIRGQI